MNLIIYLLPLSGEILLNELLEHSEVQIQAALIPESFRGDCRAQMQKLEKEDIPFRIPGDLSSNNFMQWVESFSLDLGVSVGYDKKLPAELVNRPAHGTMNIHPSLLPEYRGANPYFWAIRNREETSGVTIHWMDEEFDTGPIIDQQKLKLAEDETMGTLFFLLNRWGIEQTIEIIEQYLESGSFPDSHTQSKDAHEEAPSVTDIDLRIDWQEPYREIDALVRAANPFLGAFTTFRGGIVRIYEVEKTSPEPLKKPGKVEKTNEGPVVHCQNSGVLLRVVQMEQFYKTSGKDFQQREKKAFEVLDRMI